jgi:hypothetical protein
LVLNHSVFSEFNLIAWTELNAVWRNVMRRIKLYDAIEIIEDIDDGVYSEDKYLEAWQLLVDTGVALDTSRKLWAQGA